MKNILAAVAIIIAAFGVASFASAGGGCCAIPQRSVSTDAAAEKVVSLHIEGMICGSCEIAVKRVLTKVEGVKAATVSYEKKSAVVTYEPAKVTPETIARAVEEKLPTYKVTVAK